MGKRIRMGTRTATGLLVLAFVFSTPDTWGKTILALFGMTVIFWVGEEVAR
jgi:hypothetical protein